jgi:hypothetical protein
MTRHVGEQRCSRIADSRAALAEQPIPPRWYYLANGLLVGGYIAMASQELGDLVTVAVVLVFVLGILWLQVVYREATGFWISGIPWGRPLGWAIALVLVVVGLFLAGLALRDVWGWVGPVLAGIVAVPVVIVGGRRYDAAVRADMRERR